MRLLKYIIVFVITMIIGALWLAMSIGEDIIVTSDPVEVSGLITDPVEEALNAIREESDDLEKLNDKTIAAHKLLKAQKEVIRTKMVLIKGDMSISELTDEDILQMYKEQGDKYE